MIFKRKPELRIFISYRRDDSAFETTAIYRELTKHFGAGSVFMDVDGIDYGDDFRKTLARTLENCRLMIVIIGDCWTTTADAVNQPRLRAANDYVRLEIETGLKREIPLIPLLIGHRSMPTPEEVPESLSELTYRQAINIRPGRDFEQDIERLIRRIHRILNEEPSGTSAAFGPSPPPRTPHLQYRRENGMLGLIVGRLVLVGFVGLSRAFAAGISGYVQLSFLPHEVKENLGTWPRAYDYRVISFGLVSGLIWGAIAAAASLIPTSKSLAIYAAIILATGAAGICAFDLPVRMEQHPSDPLRPFGLVSGLIFSFGTLQTAELVRLFQQLKRRLAVLGIMFGLLVFVHSSVSALASEITIRPYSEITTRPYGVMIIMLNSTLLAAYSIAAGCMLSYLRRGWSVIS